MRLPQYQAKLNTERKAVVPDKGAAAFSCSTVSPLMSDKTGFPVISPQTAKNAANENLLLKTHYFCGGLAKHPPALVIRIEGQIKGPSFREVSA